MTLWDLKENETAAISDFKALNEAVSQRLNDLGFNRDHEVTCMQVTPFGAPRVYLVQGGVFSIAADLASSIIVEKGD